MSKKIKTEQYGVRYPDGREEWESQSSFLRLATEAERLEFTRHRAQVLKDAGVTNDPGVIFLRRLHVVTYTPAETICQP